MSDVKSEFLTQENCKQLFPKQSISQRKEIERERKYIKNELQKQRIRERDLSAQDKTAAKILLAKAQW